LTDDVTWITPNCLASGGTRRGPEAVGEYLAARETIWTAIEARPERVIADDRHVVVTGRYRAVARGSEDAAQIPFVHIWTIHDHRVECHYELTDTAQLVALANGSQR